MSDLDDFRKMKDEAFRQGRGSPLTLHQRRDFAGLSYFAEDPSLRFEVMPEPFPGMEDVQVELSTGEIAIFQRWARVRFLVGGTEIELTVFNSPNAGLFLPFKDATAASGETYAAGRYIEPEELADGRISVDFNTAYNPYCAYNQLWSCPLTPPENVIVAPIRAGEKAFTQGAH